MVQIVSFVDKVERADIFVVSCAISRSESRLCCYFGLFRLNKGLLQGPRNVSKSVPQNFQVVLFLLRTEIGWFSEPHQNSMKS